MHKKTVTIASLFTLLTTWLSFTVSAQSVLSLQSPIGLLAQHSTGPSQALGGSGIGVINDYYGMADNPGNLGGMTKSSFSSMVSLDLLSIDQGSDYTRHAALSPMLLSFSFPLKAAGTFGISLDRRSDARLKYRTHEVVSYSTGDVDTVDFGLVKRGGLTSWQAGWGYAIGSWARVGISYERMYLLSDEITMWRGAMGTIWGTVSESTLYDTTAISFPGNAIRAGILVPVKKLTVGVTGEYVVGGTAKKMTMQESPDTVTTTIERFSLRLPPSLGAGVSYNFSPRWMAAASGGVTLWRNYSSGITLGLPTDDAFTFSCGGQFIPAPNLLVPRYWEIMQYRAGFRYAQLPIAGGSEAAFTLGFGLPFQQGSGLFDIIVDFGRRSNNAYEGYSENFLNIKIGLNGGKQWFQNTGIRY